MVDHVFKFQSSQVNFVSSRRFSIADYVIYLRCIFLCYIMLFWHFLDYFPFVLYIRRRDFYAFSSEREKRRKKETSVLIYCGSLARQELRTGAMVRWLERPYCSR